MCFWQSKSCTKWGIVLLNTLTQALQSSGVDLSQASISVQIDLGKRANRGLPSGTSIAKDHENPPPSNHIIAHHRDASSARTRINHKRD
ncbi:hypothetical protein CK203_115583 [Vitis vinifera]|uniref:Uncharacterized protein n=1 Tax=Vitis vinifera TaxID=29760 RepID=A0A438EA66_VITVI|nr:hypothetical protein CK203_115583 [Vitis vinifera]